MPKKMVLVSLTTVPVNQYTAAWRDDRARTDFLDAAFWQDLGRLVERGGFDMLFLADQLSIAEDAHGDPGPNLRAGGKLTLALDPLVTLGIVAGATTHLGLGATISTSFFAPYDIARAMLTLDHLSAGRAAWNIVTSTMDSDARNFGLDRLPDRDARYDLAERVTSTVAELWESWAPDALKMSPGGDFADPAKVARTTSGLSRGPLTLPPSPQGRPVLMQAGASPRGVAFAAKWAELVFGTGITPETMRAQRNELRRQAKAHGRDPDSIKYLVPLQPIVAETMRAAQAEEARLRSAISVNDALDALGRVLRVSGRPPAQHRASELLAEHRGNTGTLGFEDALRTVAERDDLTVADLAIEYAMSQFNTAPVGDAATIADAMEELVDAGATDGFIVMSPVPLHSLEAFVRYLSPELRRRGRLADDRPAANLRERLFGAVDDPAWPGHKR